MQPLALSDGTALDDDRPERPGWSTASTSSTSARARQRPPQEAAPGPGDLQAVDTGGLQGGRTHWCLPASHTCRRQRESLRQPAATEAEPPSDAPATPLLERVRQRPQEVNELAAAGLSLTAIAHRLHWPQDGAALPEPARSSTRGGLPTTDLGVGVGVAGAAWCLPGSHRRTDQPARARSQPAVAPACERPRQPVSLQGRASFWCGPPERLPPYPEGPLRTTAGPPGHVKRNTAVLPVIRVTLAPCPPHRVPVAAGPAACRATSGGVSRTPAADSTNSLVALTRSVVS
jgi:hypothetical protein